MDGSKSLSVISEWTNPADAAGYIRLAIPLDQDGITIPGIMLRVGCFKYRPERHVTIEIRIERTGTRRSMPLARLDWRSLDGHSNQPRYGTEWAGKRVGPTHLHSFDLNWLDAENKMRGLNLPVAMDITEPDTFSDLLVFAGESLRISNMSLVPPPEWEYLLF